LLKLRLGDRDRMLVMFFPASDSVYPERSRAHGLAGVRRMPGRTAVSEITVLMDSEDRDNFLHSRKEPVRLERRI
jgi:hypothetical protein